MLSRVVAFGQLSFRQLPFGQLVCHFCRIFLVARHTPAAAAANPARLQTSNHFPYIHMMVVTPLRKESFGCRARRRGAAW